MKKDFMLPQGKFKIGRDLEAGIYLIASFNDLTFIYITNNEDDQDVYTLDDEKGKLVHIELEKGFILENTGKVKARKLQHGADFNLLNEIERFQNDLSLSCSKKTPSKVIIEDEEDTDTYEEDVESEEIAVEDEKPKKQKIGFWKALGMLFSSSSEIHSTSDSPSSFWSSPKKKDTGRCDGDCANCPPHYGYRYGRWYYGKDHTEGCTRGGNRGGGGII